MERLTDSDIQENIILGIQLPLVASDSLLLTNREISREIREACVREASKLHYELNVMFLANALFPTWLAIFGIHEAYSRAISKIPRFQLRVRYDGLLECGGGRGVTVQYLLKLLSQIEANGPSLTLTTGCPMADPQSKFFDVDMMSVPFTAKLFLGYV